MTKNNSSSSTKKNQAAYYIVNPNSGRVYMHKYSSYAEAKKNLGGTNDGYSIVNLAGKYGYETGGVIYYKNIPNTNSIHKGVTFASGGYTGDWPGQGGRLAMLHKKELILNADDTKNTLAALKIGAAIVNSLGLAQDNVNKINSGKIPTMDSNANNETSVIINADFPNAHDAQEIKDALNNLINSASQYAHGNRRTY